MLPYNILDVYYFIFYQMNQKYFVGFVSAQKLIQFPFSLEPVPTKTEIEIKYKSNVL